MLLWRWLGCPYLRGAVWLLLELVLGNCCVGNLARVRPQLTCGVTGAACSFCHVIIAPDLAPILPEPLRDESLRLGLLEDPSSKVEGLSRLGCQIKVTKDMEGMVVHCPDSGYSDIP